MDLSNINGYWFLFGLTLIVVIYLLNEVIRHNRNLKCIPIRVHVNGTRGKSSVTRLIASGLRAGNIRTCAKTTGTMARYIDPDGNEEPVYRFGRTNVIEQVGIVKKAVDDQAEALVIECMALQPLLQSLCELKLVKSTHGVLCNARPDHLDVMGPLEEDVALALAGTMTIKGHYFTAETKHLGTFIYAAKDRKSVLHHVTHENITEITDEEMSHFTYAEHKDNVALALAVCEHLGVRRDVALKGMWSAMPDPGALTVTPMTYENSEIIFVNGFAANDPFSTKQIWDRMRQSYSECDKMVLLMNCRVDRKDRSQSLAEEALKWERPDEMMAIGTGVDAFCRVVEKSHAFDKTLTWAENWPVEKILQHLAEDKQARKTLVVGIGNIKGVGFKLIERVFEIHQ
ncbi:MAG: poly-gamma-glutamate synthase PgsB [Gammaproteobacteria bacterium]